MKSKKKISFWGRFFEPVRAKPKNFITLSFFSFLRALQSVSFARYLEQITKALENNNKQHFFFWMGILGGTVILWFCIRLFDRKFFFHAAVDAENYIFSEYITRYFYADNTKIEKLGSGRIISVLRSGILNRSAKLTDVFWQNLYSILTIIFSLALIASKSLPFFGIAIITLFIVFLWVRKFGPYALQFRRKMKDIVTEIDRTMTRQVMSKFEILQHNKIKQEILQYKKLTQKSLGYREKEKFWQGIAYDGSNFFVGLFRAVVIGGIGYAVLINSGSMTEFVLFASLSALLVTTISDLAVVGRTFSDALIHVEKLWNVFDDLYEETNITGGKAFAFKQGNITFDKVAFAYDGGDTVFSQFSLDIVGGTKTALVGTSGGGKTTLLKLISLYTKPSAGTVKIDGQALNEINILTYLKHIGYLTQEPSVFDGTIRENLEYSIGKNTPPTSPQRGGVERSETEGLLQTVIPLAKCEWIYDLPHGLDTEIGERGIRLSGGQKQRLAIAKIMLKNPDIILLDEPTSALDSANEQAVTEALNNLFIGKTVIIIAHRLQTVKHADDIIYIDHGNIIERGTHAELLALGGEYYKMVELQSGF